MDSLSFFLKSDDFSYLTKKSSVFEELWYFLLNSF